MSTAAEGTSTSATAGTGGGLVEFLNWTIDKNELVDATASALRTGCVKVLSVEQGWESLDLRNADLDSIVSRFKNKHRLDMKDRTRDQYEQRLRQSVEMYMKWLADDPTWKPAQRRRPTQGNGSGAKPPQIPVQTHTSGATAQAPAGPVQSQAGMIAYPFPIRPGLRGMIELPEDLTAREAQRIAAFVATLAVGDEGLMVSPAAESAEPANAT